MLSILSRRSNIGAVLRVVTNKLHSLGYHIQKIVVEMVGKEYFVSGEIYNNDTRKNIVGNGIETSGGVKVTFVDL